MSTTVPPGAPGQPLGADHAIAHKLLAEHVNNHPSNGGDVEGIPPGGLTAQALVKGSNLDHDVTWADQQGAPGPPGPKVTATIAPTAPPSPEVGDLWLDPTAAPVEPWRPHVTSGLWMPQFAGSLAEFWIAANSLRVTRCYLPSATMTVMSDVAADADQGSAYRVVVYEDVRKAQEIFAMNPVGNMPGDLKWQSDPHNNPTEDVYPDQVTPWLDPGWYWVGAWVGDIPIQLRCLSGLNIAMPGMGFPGPNNMPNAWILYNQETGPTSTFPTGSEIVREGLVPAVWMQAA